MFVMMNAARLHVALQGIGLLDAAWQKADAYARERRQMRAPGAAPATQARPDRRAPAGARVLDTQRAWIDGARLIAYRTAMQLDVARHGADAAAREAAQRWCNAGDAGAQGRLHAAGLRWRQRLPAGLRRARLRARVGHRADRARRRVTMIYEGTNEIQAIDLLVRKVLPDAGAGLAATLLALRGELDASRDADADVQRRLAQLRYLTTQLAMAVHARPRLAYEVADDYLRLVMLAMLAWAWARIERAPGADEATPARPRPSGAGCCRSSRCGPAS